MSIKIFPSILAADFANLQRDIDAVPSADGLHVDVMDAHFVPNLTIGIPVLESIRRVTDKFLDVHLMIDDPVRWASAYVDAGADSVTFHIEAAQTPVRLINQIHRLGAQAAIALKPTTPIEPYGDIIDLVDMVLIMTVEPGFGGQGFLDFVLPKIARTRELIDRSGADVRLEVDGGISTSTIEACRSAGADVFVAGSAVFGAQSADAAVRELRKHGAAARQLRAHPWAQRAIPAARAFVQES